jgi:hypothetical protein
MVPATALHGELVVFHLSPAAFNFTLDAAAANYRVDALLGNSSGTYNIFKGTESTTVAVPPTVFQ